MWIIFLFLVKQAAGTPFMITDQCIDICKNAQLPALELVIRFNVFIFVFYLE